MGILAIVAGVFGCSDSARLEPTTHDDRVIEDVTAITEGMARAHSEEQQALEAPGLRSVVPD